MIIEKEEPNERCYFPIPTFLCVLCFALEDEKTFEQEGNIYKSERVLRSRSHFVAGGISTTGVSIRAHHAQAHDIKA